MIGNRPIFGGPVLADILTRENNSFGVMRLLLASVVVVSHAFMMQAGQMAADPLQQWTGYTSGQHGVQGFFVLSGLLVAQGLAHSRGVIDFASARFLRIFPGLAVCVLLTALVLGPLVSTLSPGSYFSATKLWSYIATTMALKTGSAPLPGVFETLPMANIVNLSLWTLKFEVLCYACLGLAAVVALVTPQRRQGYIAIAVAVAVFLLMKHPALIESNSFFDSLRYFALFFATGVAAYVFRNQIVIDGAIVIVLAALFALSIGTQFTELAAALLLGYGMLWLSTFSFGPLRRITSHHDISYGVYIYGVPVTQTLMWLSPGMGVLALIVLSFVFVVPLAAASWLWIERPAMGLRAALRDRLEGLTAQFSSPPRRGTAEKRIGVVCRSK
jgi:peptidoglycan/LPS O-acetylase OafA/YrhL